MLNRVDIYALVLYETWPGVRKHTHTARGLKSTNPPAAGLTQQSLIALFAAKRSVHSSLPRLWSCSNLEPVSLETPVQCLLFVLWFLSRVVALSPDRSQHMHVISEKNKWHYSYRLQPVMRSWWCHHLWDSTKKAILRMKITKSKWMQNLQTVNSWYIK